ncbi:hypothetical protein [Ornithinimicrobium pekingense]|uniref:DUF222 domain-containing protein n=1 Tax=Ornithinimicrobium pekingense TaxID=384677 RepID=A0ABQ2FFW1_9MICO|nr:hypothetical protein [Ornithinimicrobium pekingense]GGK83527.1 hypothetical protein GCM10011509_34980 [Ornithinimicrobium pekingense]
MSYLNHISELVETHRQSIEEDLADARAARAEAHAALAAVERRVASLEGLLELTTPTELSKPHTRMTLHEAMRTVLESVPERRMPAAELAKTIAARGLYRMRDGRPVEAQQVHARVGHYQHMFVRDAHGIGLA